MADDLDKFVLQYQVDLKDSISRLEKLQEKMNGVGSASSKSKSELKKFTGDAAGELGKLVPGLNAVSTAVRAMGTEFAAATVALGALAMGVKAVMDLRQQYNMQRSQGMEMGVSSLRMENWQRQFVRQGHGYVTRDSAAEGLKNFADMSNAAYQDPSRLGREARLMRMLGVDVGERGATPTGLQDRLTQLATGLQGKSTSQVQGIAKSTGMNQDWLLTLQRLGPEVAHITDLTNQEIQNRQQAEDALGKFNDDLSKLKEKFVEVSNELAEPLLPALSKLVELMTKLAGAIPGAAKAVGDKTTNTAGGILGVDLKSGKMDWGTGLIGLLTGGALGKPGTQNRWGIAGMLWDSLMGGAEPKKETASKQQQKQDAKKEQDKRDAAVNKMDEANKQGIQTANQMSLAVNMFAGAVQSFSSAININQAWAAWAGEIGKANGLPGSSGSGSPSFSGGGNGKWYGSNYADSIKSAAAKYGLDPQMLYAIMMTESHGKNGQYSETGAGGLMQVTKGNWKAYGGGRDVMDPAANIDVGARIYAENLKKYKGDTVAALAGYNGHSDPGYVAKVGGWYGGNNVGKGESRAKMNMRSVQQSIADYLHVPLDQIQRGGVTRGDARWADSQIEAGIQNHIYDLKRQLSVAGMPQQNYAKLQQELAMQSRGLDLMRQYSGSVVGSQAEGERQRTIGEMPIYININGVTDPKAVGQAVNDALRKSMTDLLVNNATGIKG